MSDPERKQTGPMAAVRALVLVLLILLAGCSAPDFPRDPEGTLLRVMGGELHVGVSPNPPHTEVADDGSVSGTEVGIIEDWAATLGAEVVWSSGAESALMEQLRLGELDVLVGGLASDSPWSTHAALTRPYTEVTGPDGNPQKLVLAARLGENALLVSLESFLIDEGLEP